MLTEADCTAQGLVLDPGPPCMCISDNPLVFPDTGEVLSGGNFHAEPVAFAADQLALAIAEILKGPEVAKEVQLSIQYAPDPVYHSGDPSTASPETLYNVSSRMKPDALRDIVKDILSS